jgi:hypothetical protein
MLPINTHIPFPGLTKTKYLHQLHLQKIDCQIQYPKWKHRKKKKDIQKTVPLYSTAGKWRPAKNIDVCIYII